jgi:hypothetical protein
VGELVHPEIEIHTERAVHRGREAAMDWSAKRYDHLVRRWVPIEITERAGGLSVKVELQYVWRDSGEVANATPAVVELEIKDGAISSWSLID